MVQVAGGVADAGSDGLGAEAPSSLDALLTLDARVLRHLYRGARVPRLSEVRGDLKGRMLAIPAITGVVADGIRRFAGSSAFPWKGKSFWPDGESTGEGINRVLSERLRLFRFSTFVGPSRAGDFDAVQLDYDRPSNPFFIRAIKDEIREIGPGLYLGQAYLQIGCDPKLALYFGLSRG